MASNRNTFSSALSYALELLGTPNLTLNEEQQRRYTKEILCSYGYRQDLVRAFATKLRDRVQERATW